jgi:hypothetical protein
MLLSRICVRPPYFALHDLTYHSGQLSATAHQLGRSGHELGPMPGAEVSRHAAIAGLCAAALAQPDGQRRYYLAQEATYQGVVNLAPAGSVVTLHAELLELDRRRARARITAQAGHQPLASVEVLYTVLTDSAFSRLFRARHQPAPPNRDALQALPVGVVRPHGHGLIREIDEIPVDACAGHFEGYPAMPVAILMGQLAGLAGQHFGAPFHIRAASVEAHDFCWAGEAARFEVDPESVDAAGAVYRCAAYASGRPVGQMRLVLEASG